MSTSRPSKHERPTSTISHNSPKRLREAGQDKDLRAQSEMSWQESKREEGKRRGQKRDNVEVESSTEAGSLYSDDEGEEGESLLRKYDNGRMVKAKKIVKSAKIEGQESPEKKGHKKGKHERQAELQSIGTSKGKGKRAIDDSEDREIGEEWIDLNGLRWKMGEDGQIRREAVKMEMRPKYPSMPKDSRHPDAKIKVQVLVERFLTEKEYEEAKAKKLLSFQELERQKEIDEAEKAAKKKQEEEEAQRKRTIEAGRQVTTPKKIRDLQALFHSARKPSSSPLNQSIPMSSSRSRSLSAHSSLPNTPSYSSVKRLSLSMGKDELEASPSEKPISRPSPPQPAPIKTPLQNKISYRLPLASPSSPAINKVAAANIIRNSPASDNVAKKKREETLLKLLQKEAERRKKLEKVK